MAMLDTDVMISIGGRWWCFPGAQIDLDSEFEWRSDGKLRLHDSIGNVVEGLEVDNPEVLSVDPRQPSINSRCTVRA
jgi:hypothetical protein